ncbi:cyclase family protein [soil metagenome]
MSRIEYTDGGGSYKADLCQQIDLSIPLAFDGPQPNHFGAPPAIAEPLELDGFIGDTRRGGSCNAESYRLIPHCNGTHTECVGHVTDDRVSIRDAMRAALCTALLVTVEAGEHEGNRQITASGLAAACDSWRSAGVSALIIRTVPNGYDKRSRRYEAASLPPYLTPDAARSLVVRGIDHLLVDLPSVDPYHDGKLEAHRIFWGLPAGSRRASEAARASATITEMIFVPDEVADGHYLLNLQIAPFATDAAPSRPLLFPLDWSAR